MRKCPSRRALYAIGVGATLAIALSANAQSSGQVFFQTTSFGMVGLARNQVARLNVLNPGNACGIQDRICSAEMEFLDDQGHTLKSNTAEVGWGKAVSLELDRKELTNGGLRVPLRAVVKTAINPPGSSVTSPVMPGAVCNFMPTVEIFDKDTGKTALVMSEGRSVILNTPSNVPARAPARPSQ